MKQQGNIMIMVVLLAMIAVTFFVFLMGYSLRNIEQVNNLQNSTIAYYAAEAAIEQSLVEYYAGVDGIPKTILPSAENICSGFTELGESIIDFFNCPGGSQIGTLNRVATRYRTRIEGFLDRFSVTELWLTDEEKETDKNFSALKSIKLEWNTFGPVKEKGGIEVILARFPKDMPQNMQTAQVNLVSGSGLQTYIVKEFLPPVRDENNQVDYPMTDEMDPEHYHYIVFLKTGDEPTHYRLTGLDFVPETEADASAENIQYKTVDLPARNLTILSKAVIEDKRDPALTITRALQVEKEIYTDYDSRFDYAKHRVE